MLNATGRSKGLRKFMPQPDRFAERYGRFTLTARDVEILDVVHRYRYLEARHIRALVGGSDQQITRRLQGLFHNKYLGRYARRERMRLELDPGAPLIAYGLELRGARALERRRETGAAAPGANPVRWKKEYTRRTEWFLEHQLMVSNFRCVLEVALRDAPDTELVTWKQGKDAWLRARIPGERGHFARIAPDAYFVLRQGDELRHFYLEADRSTEEHRRLRDKFVRYWHHLRGASLDESKASRQRFVVLFVTTGERRMLKMIDTLAQTPKPSRARSVGKGVFQFCAERAYDISNPGSLLGTIWSSVNESSFTFRR